MGGREEVGMRGWMGGVKVKQRWIGEGRTGKGGKEEEEDLEKGVNKVPSQ